MVDYLINNWAGELFDKQKKNIKNNNIYIFIYFFKDKGQFNMWFSKIHEIKKRRKL